MTTLFQWQQKGHLRPLDPTGTQPVENCNESEALILSGTGVTDLNGFWELDLRRALCLDAGIFKDPSMVATPTFPEKDSSDLNSPSGPRPVFVTTEWTRPLTGQFLLRVRSWEAHGHPAPEVPFSWHLRVYSDFVGGDLV